MYWCKNAKCKNSKHKTTHCPNRRGLPSTKTRTLPQKSLPPKTQNNEFMKTFNTKTEAEPHIATINAQLRKNRPNGNFKKIKCRIDLPEGQKTAVVSAYTKQDCKTLKEIYTSWLKTSQLSVEMAGRGLNVPEVLSEGVFSALSGSWRVGNVSGANSSFDCYDPVAGVGNNRIQVKSCSVIPDLSSFGPKSVWDRIFFIDFYRYGKWDYTFDVYELSTEDINSYQVSSQETVLEQKSKGKRPRLSLYDTFVKNGKYISKKSYKITETGILGI